MFGATRRGPAASFDPGEAPPPRRDARTSIKVLSLNIAHGRGVRFNQVVTPNRIIRRNLDALARYLKWEDADVVGLQEVDEGCIWSGGVDQAAHLAREAGYAYSHIGVNTSLGWPTPMRYGNALLSRYPVGRYLNHPFGDRALGEKGFLEGRLELGGVMLTAVSLHLDPVSPRQRTRQVRALSAHLSRASGPVIVLGDFNVAPPEWGEQTLAVLADATGLHTWPRESPETISFPSWNPRRRIDFVFASRELDFVSYATRSVSLSDHLPVVAELALIPAGEQ